MGEMRRVSVDLSDESAAVIDQMVASGHFTDEQDVVRFALLYLRGWQSNDVGEPWNLTNDLGAIELGRFWKEGLASGEPINENFDPEDIVRRGMIRLAEARAAPTHQS